MEIVDTTKFAIGIVFALVGAAVLVLSRGTPGFSQRKQAGALMLVGAVVFVTVGLGLIDF
jgi:hypothetical protein